MENGIYQTSHQKNAPERAVFAGVDYYPFLKSSSQ